MKINQHLKSSFRPLQDNKRITIRFNKESKKMCKTWFSCHDQSFPSLCL